jgi:formate C-acetyltransferase
MLKHGDEVLGLETGNPLEMNTWDEFWNAYEKQHHHFLKTAFYQQYVINNLRA